MLKKLIALAFAFSVSQAHAAVIYDESIDGDAAGANGRQVGGVDLGSLTAGVSSVIAASPGNFDDDWFKFTIDTGFTLESIILAEYVGPGGNLGWSNNGIGINVNNSGPLNDTLVGTDLLEGAALSSVADAFGAGTYAIKLGTGTNVNSYTIDFNVVRSNVSEPLSVALMGLGLVAFGASRARNA